MQEIRHRYLHDARNFDDPQSPYEYRRMSIQELVSLFYYYF